jgi:hypothetical protein
MLGLAVAGLSLIFVIHLLPIIFGLVTVGFILASIVHGVHAFVAGDPT